VFRACYNHERPHEALGLACPVSRYRPSAAAYVPDERLAAVEYRAGDAVRTVDTSGRVSVGGRRFKVGKAFVRQRVGLRASARAGAADGLTSVWFGEHEVGVLDLRSAAESMSLPPAPAALV